LNHATGSQKERRSNAGGGLFRASLLAVFRDPSFQAADAKTRSTRPVCVSRNLSRFGGIQPNPRQPAVAAAHAEQNKGYQLALFLRLNVLVRRLNVPFRCITKRVLRRRIA